MAALQRRARRVGREPCRAPRRDWAGWREADVAGRTRELAAAQTALRADSRTDGRGHGRSSTPRASDWTACAGGRARSTASCGASRPSPQAQAAQDQAEADRRRREAALSRTRDRLTASEAELAALGPDPRRATRDPRRRRSVRSTLARQQVAAAEQLLRETRAAVPARCRAARGGAARPRPAGASAMPRIACAQSCSSAAPPRPTRRSPAAPSWPLPKPNSPPPMACSTRPARRWRQRSWPAARRRAGWRDLRRSADAVEAEIKVLASLAPETDAGGLLDRLEVPEELTAALAAALGDDLLAGTDPDAPRFWRESTPAGLRRAAARARGRSSSWSARRPCCIARLSQIGLAAPRWLLPRNAMLKPGQRLVSPDGGLWRWDGFVRAPGSEDGAAARVRHHLRLHAARDELAVLRCKPARRRRQRSPPASWRCRRHGGPGARARRVGGRPIRPSCARVSGWTRRQRSPSGRRPRPSRLAQEAAALERDGDRAGRRGDRGRRAAAALADEAALAAVIAANALRRPCGCRGGAGRERGRDEPSRSGARSSDDPAAHIARRGWSRRRRSWSRRARRRAQAARHTGELEAERRAREAALAREGAELAAALAAAEPATSPQPSKRPSCVSRSAPRRSARWRLPRQHGKSAGDALAGARAEAAALAHGARRPWTGAAPRPSCAMARPTACWPSCASAATRLAAELESGAG